MQLRIKQLLMKGLLPASDQDANDTFTFSVSGDVLTIDAETGVLSFVSAPDFETTTEAIQQQ